MIKKFLFLSVFFFSGCQGETHMPQNYCTLTGKAPLIIAHRGASGHRPEHTLAAYQLAMEMGADYIEPDLVITKDGHLIARHDRYLSTTTNVAVLPEFANRKTEKLGHDGADWFAEDFTLEEIKTLRARQPRAGRETRFDDQNEIPTFDEVLALAKDMSEKQGRRIGIYPETKHPAALEALGLSFDAPLLKSLSTYGYGTKNDPVFIQSFEDDNLKRLKEKTSIRLVYLSENRPEMSFEEIAQFASGIGPYKILLSNDALESTGFIEGAHAAGLAVHPWTFRDDQPDARFPDKIAEARHYFDLGIDGGFFDFPDTGVAALKSYNCP